MSKLTHVEDRIVVKINMSYKDSHTFSNGMKISLERKYNNFDEKYTKPVNAIVVSAKHIPEGSEILIHHNCTHDTNRLFNYQKLSGKVEADDVRYFSISENDAFVWRSNGEWQPLPGYDFALRVFRPYKGSLQGIEPEKILSTLLVTTGEYKGLICHTIKAVDYELIFQDVTGREARLIRIRTHGDEKTQREEEIVAINHSLTKLYNEGKLLAGLSKSDAKPIKEYG
jgi:hypothetical protein